MKLRYAFVFAVLAATLWMVFDNVFSDDAPIRALAEKAACTKQKCELKHQMTREERAPWGQTIDFTWHDATVRVSCHRAYWVVGARECTAD